MTEPAKRPRGEPRTIVSTRMAKPGIEQIDGLGAGIEPKPSRSDIIRALLAEALSSPPVRAGARRRLRNEGL